MRVTFTFSAGWHIHRNPNSEGLPYWPVMDHDEQYLQLDIQPSVGRALKARRLQFWTKTLPQKIQELKASQALGNADQAGDKRAKGGRT